MSQFHLLRPEWLLALLPLALVLWWLLRRRQDGGNWQRVCDPELLPFLLVDEAAGRATPTLPLIGVAGLIAILALAGPSWRQLERPLFQGQGALVILLDLSASMGAGDIAPSRLVRARYKLQDILHKRREGQTALIAYAAQPFVVTPLTDDNATIASQVNSLTTDIMPSQGSRPDLALTKAIELLTQAGLSRGDLLLICDGPGSVQDIAGLVGAHPGVRISVLGVGTAQGAPIPAVDGGFVKNGAGEIVIPRLNEGALRQLANAGGGHYTAITSDDQDIDRLLALFQVEGSAAQASEVNAGSSLWQDEGPWLVLLLLPLAAFAFRRGYLLLLLPLLLPLPRPVQALEWERLWSRPDQQAAQRFQAGEPETAAELFQDPAWKAAAHYRAGEFQQALEALDQTTKEEQAYNRGNALARLGRIPEAIAAYDKALAQDPSNDDARHNRDLLKKLLAEQQQAPPEQSKNSDDQAEENQSDAQHPAGNQPQERSKAQSGSTSDNSPQQSAEENEPGEQAKPETDAQPQSQASESEQNAPQSQPGDADASEEPVGSQPQQSVADGQAEDDATQQWLRRIPDDPGGLLRRKFRYQYQQLYQGRAEQQPW